MAEFKQENFENFLVDKSFQLAKKLEKLHKPFQEDGKGGYLDYNEGRELDRSEAADMFKQIINGHLLSSEPDWKQATVLLSLSQLLYDPDDEAKFHKGRNSAFSRLVHSHKCLPVTEDVEYQTIVMRYLRYINFWIQKQKEDIFRFYGESEQYDLLWEVFCRELETSLLNLKKSNEKKYLKQIQTAEDEITHFRWVHK